MPETDELLDATGTRRERVLGKYRGIVLNNQDPEHRGRLQATVPEVLGEIPTGWATPCAPYAGPGAGFFTVPPPGAGVWVEFEAGDVSRPIWSGGYWAAGEPPMTPPASTPGDTFAKIWRSDLGLAVALDDTGQAITISDALGVNRIVIDVPTGTVTVKGLAQIVLDSLTIREGSAMAPHPAVFGDLLLTYLTQLVTIFNTHVHPGELAGGFLPVTPAPPVAPMTPPAPSLLSLKVTLE
jgi:Type VI secretion system/phage-baseplate injector OB domain